MLRVDHITKDWEEAGSFASQVNLYGFWDEHCFLTKSGDLGAALHIGGIDYESLDRAGRDYAVKRLEAAFRSLDDKCRLYQILFKRNRPAIPYAEYESPLVRAAVEQRSRFLQSKADRLYSIEIYWVVMIDGSYQKTGLLHALAQLPKHPRSSLHDLHALFAGNKNRTLLCGQIERDRLRLQQKVNSLSGQLSDLTSVELLGAEKTFRLVRRLVNFHPSKIADAPLCGARHLDWQVCGSELEAHRGYLRMDDDYVRVLTLKELPGETRPLILNGLLDIPANFHVVTEWHPVDNAKARKEIASRRRHHHNSKTSFVSNLQDRQNTANQDNLVDDSKAAAVAELGNALTAIGMEGKSFGEFTLSVVIYGEDRVKVEHAVAEFQKLFTQHDGLLYEERYNLLNAFFATIPGNKHFNLRKQWALNSNYADLSFLFTVDTGSRWNPHLEREYLAVLESTHGTPYFLNLHAGDVAHTLMLGATGAGKSFAASTLLQSAQKYEPLTFVFDLGGSYEALTRAFSGTYLNVGLKSPGFSINPFSLEPTHENLNFLYLFLRVLIEAGGRYELSTADEKALYAALERIYKLPREIRTLTNFASILGPLGERLHRWTKSGSQGAGQFGYLFDNVDDTLTFSRFQTFNFDGWSEYPDILEPLLFYVLQRASAEIERPEIIGTFKIFLIDEGWIFLKNKIIRDWIIRAEKTWRKKNAAMILATQSVIELAISDMLHIVNESCPTKIFLSNPNIDRRLYANTFQLNDTQLELLESLVPKRELLLIQPRGTKKLVLEVDALGYPDPTRRADLFLVAGELHHQLKPQPSPDPSWLCISERGLYTGVCVVGAIGSGKTKAVILPAMRQLFAYQAADPERRLSGIVLEVKGDLCRQVRAILNSCGRTKDYVEVSLTGNIRYNPLNNDSDAYAQAFNIASVITAIWGKGKEPFWQQSYTDLVRYVIMLHRVRDGYVTLLDIFRTVISSGTLEAMLTRTGRRFTPASFVGVGKADFQEHESVLLPFRFAWSERLGQYVAPAMDNLQTALIQRTAIAASLYRRKLGDPETQDSWQSIHYWYWEHWKFFRAEVKTSIIQGIAVFLSLFETNAQVRRVFCPPKELYEGKPCASDPDGVVLPQFSELIESGNVVGLNFPTALNPALAKIIGTMMKVDYQRSVLLRIPQMEDGSERHFRPTIFICDEYQNFATVGGDNPTGDERFLSLSRQPKCIPIVATQSISSLKEALPNEGVKTLLQAFRTKIFLSTSDPDTARYASELCGKADKTRISYTVSESSSNANVGWLSGRTASSKGSVSASKQYQKQKEPLFEENVFFDLKNAQSVIVAFDGISPLPPTYCYLKPDFLPIDMTWFDQARIAFDPRRIQA